MLATAAERTWTQHPLHGELGDPWPVSNCYADLWIELLPWLGLDPIPAFSHCFAVDYEGRNWTFHKLPLRDLYTLYRLDVGEFNVWLDLDEHVEEQLARGNPVLIEADSYFLPDTEATTYRTRHQKTTIAVVALDRAASRMQFFHDNGFHALEGADYEGVFRSGSFSLPPYMEVVKSRGRPPEDETWAAALDVARLHAARVPQDNPLARYGEALPAELAALQHGAFDFHDWAFSTVRQAGSAYQYAAAFCHAVPGGGLRVASDHFIEVSRALKSLMMQVARATRRGRVPEAFPQLESAAEHWQLAIDAVRAGL